MNKADVKRLTKIGIHISGITFSFPDEAWMESFGYWNYGDSEDSIEFSIRGVVESAKNARQIEQGLLTLVKAQQSDDPRVTEMLGELETLMALTEKQDDK